MKAGGRTGHQVPPHRLAQALARSWLHLGACRVIRGIVASEAERRRRARESARPVAPRAPRHATASDVRNRASGVHSWPSRRVSVPPQPPPPIAVPIPLAAPPHPCRRLLSEIVRGALGRGAAAHDDGPSTAFTSGGAATIGAAGTATPADSTSWPPPPPIGVPSRASQLRRAGIPPGRAALLVDRPRLRRPVRAAAAQMGASYAHVTSAAGGVLGLGRSEPQGSRPPRFFGPPSLADAAVAAERGEAAQAAGRRHRGVRLVRQAHRAQTMVPADRKPCLASPPRRRRPLGLSLSARHGGGAGSARRVPGVCSAARVPTPSRAPAQGRARVRNQPAAGRAGSALPLRAAASIATTGAFAARSGSSSGRRARTHTPTDAARAAARSSKAYSRSAGGRVRASARGGGRGRASASRRAREGRGSLALTRSMLHDRQTSAAVRERAAACRGGRRRPRRRRRRAGGRPRRSRRRCGDRQRRLARARRARARGAVTQQAARALIASSSDGDVGSSTLDTDTALTVTSPCPTQVSDGDARRSALDETERTRGCCPRPNPHLRRDGARAQTRPRGDASRSASAVERGAAPGPPPRPRSSPPPTPSPRCARRRTLSSPSIGGDPHPHPHPGGGARAARPGVGSAARRQFAALRRRAAGGSRAAAGRTPADPRPRADLACRRALARAPHVPSPSPSPARSS